MANKGLNKEIEDLIKQNRLFRYEVASACGISEYTLCRWMRAELTGERREMVMTAISKLISQK